MVKFKTKFNKPEDVSLFVRNVQSLSMDVDIQSGNFLIDAKSILGIFSLDLSKPVDVVMHTEPDDPAVEQLKTNIKSICVC